MQWCDDETKLKPSPIIQQCLTNHEYPNILVTHETGQFKNVTTSKKGVYLEHVAFFASFLNNLAETAFHNYVTFSPKIVLYIKIFEVYYQKFPTLP